MNINDISIEKLDQCQLCSGITHELCFSGKDTIYHTPGKWQIVRCCNCKFMFVSPRPDRKSIGEFYPDDYKPFSSFTPGNSTSKLRTITKNFFYKVFDTRELVLPKHIKPGHLLEVGCASGRNLARFHKLGWKVSGLEPSNSALETLKKLDFVSVSQGTIESSDFPAASFDLVLASMVLEHVHNPLQDLRKIHQWLKPGRYIAGSVPNCGCWEFNFFKGEWYGLHLPHHLSHFTPKTLTAFLAASGFTDIKIYQQRNINHLMVHLGRWLDRHGLPGATTMLTFPEAAPWWLRLLSYPCALPLAWIKQAGRISFTAKKNV